MSDSNFIDNETLFLLDSYGLIYREYFAFVRRPLTDSQGRNISAVFGFFRNFAHILSKYKPTYIAAAFDSRTPTFRHEMFSEYKATRQKTPDDLKAQFPWIEGLLGTLGVPVVRTDGFEADDVIATLASECEKSGRHCVILSADKDLMQLTSTNVHIMKPDKTEIWKEIDSAGVTELWGVGPEKLLDLLSLTGDTADNVPGVKGVGDKTAVKLLTEYGSLEGIYAHADEIKGALGEKIRGDKENAFFSQKLITLRSDVPCLTGEGISRFKTDGLKFKETADELMKFQVPAVAKQYAELAINNRQWPMANGQLTTGNVKSDLGKGNPGLFDQPAFSANASASPAPLPLKKNHGNYRACTSAQELAAFVDGILAMENPLASFDSETDSLNTREANLVGFSLSCKAGEGIYVPIILTDTLLAGPTVSKKEAIDQIARLLECQNLTLVMHNAKFDLEVLINNGQCSKYNCKLADTMIAAWLLEPDKTGRTPYSLEYLAETKLGLSGTEYDEIVPKGKSFADVPLETAAAYGAEDADFTLQLWQKLEPELKEQNLYGLFTDMEMKVLPVLASMEMRGIHLDSKYLADYKVELTRELEKSVKDIYEAVGHEFNIASTKQLQKVLFEERGLKPGKKTKTGYSTDTAVLEELAALDPVPKMILDYRANAKLLSTYVEALPLLADEDGRVHTSFIQTGTATGRLSSRDPNLQNIPVRDEAGRKIRKAFTAIPGTVLISADYAQIELVVLAHLSGDKNLCAAFNEGVDVHKATAALIYGVPAEEVTADMRRSAKTINFGVMYGMSAFRLANDLGISRTQASAFIENYFNLYSGVKTFIDRQIKKAEESGYIETIMGRKRKILAINSKNKMEKAGAERVATNSPIQGSAADIVKKAMLDVDQALKENPTGAKLLLQVHDELIFECPDDEKSISDTIALIKDKMEHAVKLAVPLRVSVEYGKNWGEFH